MDLHPINQLNNWKCPCGSCPPFEVSKYWKADGDAWWHLHGDGKWYCAFFDPANTYPKQLSRQADSPERNRFIEAEAVLRSHSEVR